MVLTKVSVFERSNWRDPLPEWGRTKIFHGNFHQNSPTDFPCLFYEWNLLEISMENYTSASFWRRIVPTAPFNTWQKRPLNSLNKGIAGSMNESQCLNHRHLIKILCYNHLSMTSLPSRWSLTYTDRPHYIELQTGMPIMFIVQHHDLGIFLMTHCFY